MGNLLPFTGRCGIELASGNGVFIAGRVPARKAAARKTEPVSASLWAFLGTDDLRVKEAALAKSRELGEAAGEFGLEMIEGAADNSEHAVRIVASVIESLQTLPFFGGGKVVWLKGVTFLADTVTGRAQSTLDALERLAAVLGTLPPDVQFLLSASEVDKRRSFFLTIKKIANLEVFDLIDTSKQNWEELVANLVAQRAEEFDLHFVPEAMDLFVMMAGENSRQIENELEKLDLYLGEANRTVRPEDVRAIVSQTKGSVIFELGDAIAKRRLPLALALVDELLEQDEAPIAVLLAAVVPTVRNLFAARQMTDKFGIKAFSYQDYTAQVERKVPAKERDRLPKKKDGSGPNLYPLFLASKDAASYSADELQRALEECLRANRRLVTSGLNPVIVLNQLLIRVLPPAGR